MKIISIANQKGGVGKTTTAINLSAALANLGKKTLLLDFDPQGNASTGLGIDPDERKLTSYNVLIDGVDFKSAIHRTAHENLYIIPAQMELGSVEVELSADPNRLSKLAASIDKDDLKRDGFEFIFIDCPPSLSMLTLSAMVASDSIIVPLQCEFFALEGLTQLMLTMREVRQTLKSNIYIEGVLLTMLDRRNSLTQQVESDARDNLGDVVYKTVVPRNVRLSEAPSFGMPILHYDKRSAGAQAYEELAQEFIGRICESEGR